MNPPAKIIYLRKGRVKRACGTIIDTGPNQAVKVKPTRDSWGMVWLTKAEVEAGREKPPYEPKESKTDKPKRERKPKAIPLPRWKQLVDQVRVMEIDHHPDGWPAVKMGFISELADSIEAAQTLFQPSSNR